MSLKHRAVEFIGEAIPGLALGGAMGPAVWLTLAFEEVIPLQRLGLLLGLTVVTALYGAVFSGLLGCLAERRLRRDLAALHASKPVIGLALALACLCGQAAEPPTLRDLEKDPSRLALAREYIEVSGQAEVIRLTLEVGFENSFITESDKKALRAALPDLVEAHVALVATTFTEAEIKGAIAFHASPVGKSMRRKVVETLPLAQEVGKQWGRRALERR